MRLVIIVIKHNQLCLRIIITGFVIKNDLNLFFLKIISILNGINYFIFFLKTKIGLILKAFQIQIPIRICFVKR